MSAQPPVQRPNQPPHAAWLVLPEVERAIEGALRRKGLRGPDLEDHRQTVLERAYVSAEPPGSLGECIALVQKIARDLAIDTFRRTRSRSKFDAGPCEDPDERPAVRVGVGEDAFDTVDTRERLDCVLREIDAGNISARQVAILASAVDQVPQPEIAAEMNLAHQTVRNELAAARRTARASWAALAAATLAVLGFVFWYLRDRDRMAHRLDDDIRPDTWQAPPRPTPQQIAEHLRFKAFHECDLQLWDDCQSDLDDARFIDGGGEADPRVQRARAAIAKAHAPPPLPPDVTDDGKPRMPGARHSAQPAQRPHQ